MVKIPSPKAGGATLSPSPVSPATRGAAFLDEQRTDHWRQKVDRDRLDMGDGCDCVLGQLYGSFANGWLELGLSYAWCERLGFAVPGENKDAYAELTEAWKEHL